MSQPTTRQELYDRIQASSKDEYILTEMKRLGFWPKSEGQPTLAEQLILRESEVMKQYNALASERSRLNNYEALLKEIRKKRMEESRRKREESKLKRLQQRKERSENWKKQKTTDIAYLGEGVSTELGKKSSDTAFLQQQGLPIFEDVAILAQAMQIPVGELRWLSFSRGVSKTSHYQRFSMPKKTGGLRLISAPMPRLKNAQHWILEHILNKTAIHGAAHGFTPQKSIVSNARLHLHSEVVINLDLKDFFPTITYSRVRGIFKKLGYSPQIATIFSLICTEPDTMETELDGEKWFIGNGERYLPQGAPTSPMLTNILCRQLDARLEGLAQKHSFVYTRYADDLTFSASTEGAKKVNLLLNGVRTIVEDEGLTIHPTKTRIMRKGSCQEVTGIVVNNLHPTVSRTKLRQFRAMLHRIEKQGNTEGVTWGSSGDVLQSALGYARFVAMVHPEKGKALTEKVKALIQAIRPDYKAPARKVYLPKKSNKNNVLMGLVEQNRASQSGGSDTDNTSGKPWWKFW